MKKKLKPALLILLLGFVGIQFIPTEFNQSNEILSSDISVAYEVPPKVKSILQISCYDCHSNNTKYPFYNKLQPVAWFLNNHIEEGKEELNFSEFASYSVRRQKSKLKSIISQIEDEEMPLSSYTIIHSDAILSENDREIIINWAENLRKKLRMKSEELRIKNGF